jgi:branched-chain amino acid transport system substrate-binding protein
VPASFKVRLSRSLCAVACAGLVVMLGAPRFAGAAGADRVVRIGIDLPVSGIDGAAAIPARNAAVMAVEEANATGLPGGVKLAVNDLDDSVQGKHDPAQGAQNVKTFIADSSVLAMIGPQNSNVAKAEIPLTNEAGLAQVAFATTSVDLTKGPESAKLRPRRSENAFFRVCASDDRQGAAAARFAKRLGFKRAFIVDDDESYGKGLADVFEASFRSGGGTILGHEHLTPFQVDFKSLLTKVRGLGPDVVFYGGVVSTGGALLRKQMGDVGLENVAYVGGDGLVNPEYVPIAGRMADGTYFTLVAPDVLHFAPARRFADAYRNRWNEEIGSYSPGAYTAARIVVVAVAKALRAHPDRLPTRAEVLANVASTRDFESPMGRVTFNRNGDPTAPILSLYAVRSGKVAFVDQLTLR